MSRKTDRITRLALAALVVMALPASAATLYRYINDKGYQEIGYSIPTHLVPNGYDVIDESGRLIQRVAPQLSEEEYAARLEAQRRLEACEKALNRVHRLYESLEDIDKAERLFERKAAESLRNDQANLEFTRNTLLDRQDAAARHERRGDPVPVPILENIARAETQIETLARQIEKTERSKLIKAEQFEEERRMFRLGECNAEHLAAAEPRPASPATAEF